MSDLNRKYVAAANVTRYDVEIVVVTDEAGAAFNTALRRVERETKEQDPETWDVLRGPGRQLRWRRATNPTPAMFNTTQGLATQHLVKVCADLRPSLNPTIALHVEVLAAAAQKMVDTDSPVAALLLESITELGDELITVFAASHTERTDLAAWLAQTGLPVTVQCHSKGGATFEQGYVVGPPRAFSPALLLSPAALEHSFVMPHWDTRRALPQNPLAEIVPLVIVPGSTPFFVGGPATAPEPEPASDPDPAQQDVDSLDPAPVWAATSSRPVVEGEQLARRVLLAGGFATWLDTGGDRVRTLTPSNAREQLITTHAPPGPDRLGSRNKELAPGHYLLLREGVTESQALYNSAVKHMGPRGAEAAASAALWKANLRALIERLGAAGVQRRFSDAGIGVDTRAEGWTSTTLVRPRSLQDFTKLLSLLGLPHFPHVHLANDLNRARYAVVKQMTATLKEITTTADLHELQRTGHLHFVSPGVSGMVAARVLAISPHTTPIAGQNLRALEKDTGSQWLT